MFGLTSKTAWVFLTILGIFIGIVAFGNAVGPRTADLAQVPSAPSITRTADNGAIGDLIPAQPPAPIPETAAASGSTDTANLTQSIASLIGQSIVEKNPEGPKNDAFTVEGTERMVDRMLAASPTALDLSRFAPTPDEVAFFTDASARESAYRSAASAALSLESPALADPNASIAKTMNALAERYGAAANRLRSVAVPPNLAEEHRALIVSLLTRKRMFEAVADYDKDPVYALLVLDTLEKTR